MGSFYRVRIDISLVATHTRRSLIAGAIIPLLSAPLVSGTGVRFRYLLCPLCSLPFLNLVNLCLTNAKNGVMLVLLFVVFIAFVGKTIIL